jgi:uncharacterized cofD-like protein
VPNLKAAIQNSKARLVFVANIMTEPGETDHMGLLEHLNVIVQHLGRAPDVVLVNHAKIQPHLLLQYQNVGAEPMKQDIAAIQMRGIAVVQATLTRDGLAQHDAKRLARALMAYAAKVRVRNPLSFYFE